MDSRVVYARAILGSFAGAFGGGGSIASLCGLDVERETFVGFNCSNF